MNRALNKIDELNTLLLEALKAKEIPRETIGMLYEGLGDLERTLHEMTTLKHAFSIIGEALDDTKRKFTMSAYDENSSSPIAHGLT